MELAGQAVAVAEPEPALRADALATALLLFAEGVIVTDVFTVEFFGDIHPLAGGLDVDAVQIVICFHLLPPVNFVVSKSAGAAVRRNKNDGQRHSHPIRD